MLTLLDVILLIVLTLAAWGGWRAGATTLLLSLVGLALGIVGGLLLAGHLLSPRLATLTHLGLALLCVLGAALVGRSLGSRLGHGAAATMRRLHLRVVDGVAGAVLRVGVTGVGMWLAAAVLASLTATGLPPGGGRQRHRHGPEPRPPPGEHAHRHDSARRSRSDPRRRVGPAAPGEPTLDRCRRHRSRRERRGPGPQRGQGAHDRLWHGFGGKRVRHRRSRHQLRDHQRARRLGRGSGQRPQQAELARAAATTTNPADVGPGTCAS